MEEKEYEGNNKFEFVGQEKQQEEDNIEQLEDEKESKEEKQDSVKEEKKVNINTLLKDSGEDTDTQLFSPKEMEIIKENLKEEKDDNKSFNKIYFGYKFRVGLLITIILLCFILGCFFIIRSLKTTRTEKIEYVENADATYKVCVNSDDPYLTNCHDYSNEAFTAAEVKNINVNLSYIVNLEKNVDLDLAYHIMAINRIYDKFDSSKIIYENKDILLRETPIEFTQGKADVEEEFKIDYKKYNDFVKDYKSKYPYSSEASLEIIVFADEKESHEIGKINIPLAVDNLAIHKNFIKQDSKTTTVLLRDWTNKSTWFIVIGSILIMISILTMVYLTKFVLKTLNRKSNYEKALMDILTTYDRLIVEARDGYESDIVKKVVKVKNFGELLDAREMLNKPIIFSKINNVKSEFIVEDEDKLYKYVLKEVDVEELKKES